MTDESTPPSNPYPKIDRIHRVQACVDPSDFQYFNTLFPCQHGITSAVLSTLFHHVCNELRSIDAELKSTGDSGLVPAWGNLHKNHFVLRQILERSTLGGVALRLERGTCAGRPNDAGATNGVCRPSQPLEISPNLQSDNGSRERTPRSEAENGTEPRVGTVVKDQVAEPPALKLLREQGVLPP